MQQFKTSLHETVIQLGTSTAKGTLTTPIELVGLAFAALHLRASGQNQELFIWGFPEIEEPPDGWFIMENPMKVHDLGVPPFQETTRCWESKSSMFVPSMKCSNPLKSGLNNIR